MSWNILKTLIIEEYKNKQEFLLNNLKIKIAKLESDKENNEKLLEERKIRNEDLKKEKENFELKFKILEKDNQKIKNEKEKIFQKFENEKENHLKEFTNKKNLENEISKLSIKLNKTESYKKELLEIDKKLTPLDKIEKTFFGISGNKGKGNLAEKQLEQILKSIDLPENFWTKNLVVGSKQVEFAIKADFEEKWIPIDSKLIEHEVDEENKIIINDKFKNKVIQQVKNITKYLNKKNTSTYGVLVLQNDEIYMKLFDIFPSLFKQMIKNYKIYIFSPSSFVQFSWSIAQILEIYKKVDQKEKLYKEIMSLVDTITKFGTSVKDAYKSLKIAVNTHYEIFEKKQNKLQTNFSKTKIKKVASLEEKQKYKKQE